MIRVHSHKAVLVLLSAVLAVCLAGWNGTAGAVPPAPNNNLPTLAPGQYSTEAPPLTGAAKARTDAKSAAAMKYFKNAHWTNGGVVPNVGCEATCPPQTPTSKLLGVPFQVQQDPDWCGPATMSMIVRYKGHGYSGTLHQQQAAAAGALHTDSSGTDYGAMRPALNARIGTSFYENMPLPDWPSSSQISYFKSQLVYDANYTSTPWPLAANEYADDNYWLYNQHQTGGGIIMHWIVPMGYSSSGANTYYQDPGWGNSSGAYHEPTSYFVTALGGRGYVF